MLTEAEKERLLEIAEDLIRLKSDSGPGYEKAVGDYIYNFYRELGCKSSPAVVSGKI